ncbi:DNA phosphorothioation-dependent restriction protein DptH [Paenibacillus sp. JSM ZJ436]|uniref:DNA phosphorothioation-dependent restriction protein DptH n=1 Tax=Paenibacillus sp. JSM ZJ436 TaxID=3376190 RepID=UPI0037897142
MSNQFYNYVSNLLIGFFSKINIQPGQRYFLQLENEEEVLTLVESLREQSMSTPFVYQHDQGSAYHTFSVAISNVNLVVAFTSPGVSPDFLVTLRNQVGEQQGIWKDTALLSIVFKQLDSIQGGSTDLQKEGMPLHPKTFESGLQEQIDNSVLDKVEQVILTERMEQILSESSFQHITFFDFEEIFTALFKGKIDPSEYKDFGLFEDPDLGTYSKKEMKERISKNREMFEFVRHIHDLGLEIEELEKKLSSSVAPKLKDVNEWTNTPYTDIKKAFDEAQKVGNQTVELKQIDLNEQLKMWNKPNKQTAAGERKRHVIIFNPDKKTEINMSLSFLVEGESKSLQADQFKVKTTEAEVHFQVARTNINLKYSLSELNQPAFIKITYKHNGKANLGCEIQAVVLPLSVQDCSFLEIDYFIDTKNRTINIQTDQETYLLGTEGYQKREAKINAAGEQIHINNDDLLEISLNSDLFNERNQLPLQLHFVSKAVIVPVQFIVEDKSNVPITAFRLWKRKREEKLIYNREGSKLKVGSSVYYGSNEFIKYLEWEEQWKQKGIKSAVLESDQLHPEDLELSSKLLDAYNRLINSYITHKTTPSLCYMNEEIAERAKEYIAEYIKEINSFYEGRPVGRKGRDLFKLGIIHHNEDVLFTPYHPLNIAYQLQLEQDVQGEKVDDRILERLRPESLLPFIYENRKEEYLYKSDSVTDAYEWVIYKNINKVSVTDANKYLSIIVMHKLKQFEEHFSYLFTDQIKAPYNISLINIENDHEVVRGILQWFIESIKKKGVDNLRKLHINLFREYSLETEFDRLSIINSSEELFAYFGITWRHEELDSNNVLRLIRKSISYYKKYIDPGKELDYAHITFYRMNMKESYAVQPMNEMPAGIALNGLYSYLPSFKYEENYRSGFGTKYYVNNKNSNPLIDLSMGLNELAANLKNEGNDSFHKGEAITSRTTTADEEFLRKIFDSSHWVTFVDSHLDLDYFNQLDENLFVIHYSDQYSSSNGYDAITVTNKSNHYLSVISEYLGSHQLSIAEDKAIDIIKAFNIFNGEWLLKIIGSKGHYSREKFSIISAIKFALAYFDHSDIHWVPISLEEILRVAGSSNLSKTDGTFTAKNLGVRGVHSDDLLLMGVEEKEQKLLIHFYPIEVKIGINNNNVKDKAANQVLKTKKIFQDALSNAEMPFTSRFYRYFFAQLFIVNAAKLHSSDFWPEKNFDMPEHVIEKLVHDQIEITFDVDHIIGAGAVISFQKDAYHRSTELTDQVTYLNLTESDGLNGLIKSMAEMYTWMQHKDNDLIKENLLSNQYNTKSNDHSITSAYIDPNGSLKETAAAGESSRMSLETDNLFVNNKDLLLEVDIHEERDSSVTKETSMLLKDKKGLDENNDITNQITSKEKRNIRVLIGTAENSSRKIFWEYDHAGLANRHLLISGKSGQGKTYFMQCLLLELSKQDISSIVIDYTEGFLPNQLEPEFVGFLGPKLNQRVVYNEKVPINPFKRNIRDIGGITLPESDTDIAERIKSVFASVYKSLGIQQLNAIYEAVLNGLGQAQDRMDLNVMREMLEEDSGSASKTALSQIRPFIDRQIFINDHNFSWSDMIDNNGVVNIIQLTGYPNDVQRIITEFILWDLWNYLLRNGSKFKPVPLVLDEAQNLDHREQSPSAKILTEGRKFGWSGWFATQFLKSQLDADELARMQNSAQKIYFAQTDQEVSFVSSSLAAESSKRKHWEERLNNLRKGQCIVQGTQLLDSGELTPPTETVVNITPLQSRI